MIDKIGIAAATVVQSGTVGPAENNGQGFAEELAKQLDEKQQSGCCGGDQKPQEAVASISTNE